MKRSFFTFLLAAIALPICAAEPNTLTAEEKDAGWKLLFDGKTTNGWTALGKRAFPTKGWSVVDGALFHAKGGGGDIVTVASFGDFELSWEWKIAAVGNGGLKYNLPDATKAIGFEYQMLDDEQHPDGIKGGRLHQSGSLYDLIEPAVGVKPNPVGEWNQSRIIVNGNHVEQWLNGVKSVEFEFGSDALKTAIAKSKYKAMAKFGEKTKSPILLQDHGDEVSVRNLKIRELAGK